MAPPGSEKIDIRAGKEMVEFEDDVEDEMKSCKKPKLRNFFVPIFILIGAICMFDFNMQIGIIIAILLGFVFFVFQGMDPEEYADAVVEGLKNMVMPILLMILAFCFANASQQVGFIDYVIDVAVRNISLPLLPITVFLVFACTEFIMGINWGMYIIALPTLRLHYHRSGRRHWCNRRRGCSCRRLGKPLLLLLRCNDSDICLYRL